MRHGIALAGSPASNGILYRMASETTTLDLILTKGLQTKVDPKVQLEGELLTLENAVFDKIGRYNKRNGFSALPQTTDNGGTISSARALANFGDALCLFDGNNLYNYAPNLETWIDNGKISSVIASSYEVVQNGYQQGAIDIAYDDGIEVHVREDSRNTLGTAKYTDIFYSVIDSRTRTQIVPDTIVKAGAVRPKVFSFGDYFLIAYVDIAAKDLSYKLLTKSNIFAGLSAEADISTNIDVDAGSAIYHSLWDGVVSGSRLFVAYKLGGTVNILYVDSNLSLSPAATISETPATFISINTDASNRVWVWWDLDDSPDRIRYTVRDNANSQVLAATNAVSSTNLPNRATAIVDGNTATLLFETRATDGYNYAVYSATANTAGSITSPAKVLGSVGIAGRAFKQGAATYLPLVHSSTLQSTYFIYDLTNETLIAKLLPGTAGGHELQTVTPSVVSKGDNVWLFPMLAKGAVQTATSLFFSLNGVRVAELDFSNQNAFLNCDIGENLLVAGSIVKSFDGARITEHNFHLYPENLSLTASNTINGAIANGTYFYRAVYEYIDNKGNVHRSTPSPAYAITVDGSNDTVSVKVPTLKLTDKEVVRIDIYRTEKDGTVFYRLTGIGDELYNDPSVDDVTYVDEYADSEIIANQPLYTEGEVYNSAPPGCQIATVWKNRAWLAGLEDPNAIWFSKYGAPANFNDSFVIVTPGGGRIKDVCPLGDFLVIFKETAIYSLYGSGPLNTGTNSDFGSVNIIASDLGAKFTGCAVEIPDGIMFVSNKGIYLLNREAQLIPIGTPVEDFKSLDYVSAVAIPDKNLAIFGTSEGIFLVYDWFNRQWGTWTNLNDCSDLLTWEGALIYSASDGTVYQQSSDSFTDDGEAISLKIGTGNFMPAGPQGWFQLHKITITGEYKSAHTLKVEIDRDFQDDLTRTLTVNATSLYALTGRYQFDHTINQKMQSFRLTIYDDEPNGEGYALQGIRIEFAPLSGSSRVSAHNKLA